MDEELAMKLGEISGQVGMVISNQKDMSKDIKTVAKSVNEVENKQIALERDFQNHVNNPNVHYQDKKPMSKKKKIVIGTGTASILSAILLIIADVISATGVI